MPANTIQNPEIIPDYRSPHVKPISEEEFQTFKKFYDEKKLYHDHQTFHPNDVSRLIESSDRLWASCFIKQYKNNMKQAAEAASKALKWRAENSVAEIHEKNIEEDDRKNSAVFVRGRANDGTRVVYMVIKKFGKSKGKSSTQQQLINWLESLHRNEMGRECTFVMNVGGAGISNLDMSTIKFIKNCLDTYFPAILRKVVIVDLPWILNTMWSVVKQWLNEQQKSRVSFLTESKLNATVISQLESSPEDEKIWKCSSNQKTSTDEEDLLVKEISSILPKSSSSETLNIEASSTNVDSLTTKSSSETISTNRLDCQLLASAQPTGGRNKPKLSKSACINITKSFKISPSEMLDFDLEEENNNEKNLTTKITLTNSAEADKSMYITYKVKTNSPQKFFVKPNIGVIPPGKECVLLVSLDKTQISTDNNDKFLILFDKFNAENCDNLTSMWREKETKKEFLHQKLKVRLFNKNGFKDKALSTQKFCASRSRRGYVRFDSVNENQETLQVSEIIESGKMKLVAGVFCLILFFLIVFGLYPTLSLNGWEKVPRYIPYSDASQQ